MERKFEPAKLYKLTKLIVNIVAILGLIWFGILVVNDKSYNDYNLKTHNECIDNAKGNTILLSSCIDVFLGVNKDYADNMKLAAILGIVLPVFFYGGGSLYRYLFPKIKNKN